MPGFNRSGPEGMGPMTGRGRGMCTTDRPVYGRGVAGNTGFGRRMGLGRGFRGRFRSDLRGYPVQEPFGPRDDVMQASPEDAYSEIEALKAQAESMQRTLQALNNRMTVMENN